MHDYDFGPKSQCSLALHNLPHLAHGDVVALPSLAYLHMHPFNVVVLVSRCVWARLLIGT
jgi:hypothetical protein